MIARGSRSEREVNELVNQPAGRHKWIGIQQARSTVIERHGVVVRNAAVTMVPTVAAGVAAALVAIAEAEAAVSEVEEVFEAVVAGASGTVGRFRSGGDFPTRWPQASHGEVSSTSLMLGACGR